MNFDFNIQPITIIGIENGLKKSTRKYVANLKGDPQAAYFLDRETLDVVYTKDYGTCQSLHFVSPQEAVSCIARYNEKITAQIKIAESLEFELAAEDILS